MENDLSVLILAAGKSIRMGQPKMMLEFYEGISFLENLLIQFTDFGCQKIAVVVNEEGNKLLLKKALGKKYPIQIIVNKYPEKERFYSIQCGLKQLQETEFIFIQNADNPFAEFEVLQKLYGNRKNADYIKPVFQNRGGHPVLLSNKIIRKMVDMEDYDMPFNAFLRNYRCEEVEVDNDHIFVNVNSESDYLRLRKSNKK